MQVIGATTIALTLALVAPSSTACAQNAFLSARDGEAEHQLYVSGLIGVYIVGPAGSPVHSRVACAVWLRAEGERHRLEVRAAIQLGRAARPACDPAALPRVSLNEEQDGGTLLAAPGSRPLPTESSSYASLVYPNEAEAIGAAASIAQALGASPGDCGYLDSDASNAPPRDHTFYCWTGLSITVSVGPSGARIGLQHQYARQLGHCEGFAEAHDFREIRITGTDSLCAHGHVLLARDRREEVAEALGPCREPRGGSDGTLRCGPYEVRIDPDGSLRVRRTSP